MTGWARERSSAWGQALWAPAQHRPRAQAAAGAPGSLAHGPHGWGAAHGRPGAPGAGPAQVATRPQAEWSPGAGAAPGGVCPAPPTAVPRPPCPLPTVPGPVPRAAAAGRLPRERSPRGPSCGPARQTVTPHTQPGDTRREPRPSGGTSSPGTCPASGREVGLPAARPPTPPASHQRQCCPTGGLATGDPGPERTAWG